MEEEPLPFFSSLSLNNFATAPFFRPLSRLRPPCPAHQHDPTAAAAAAMAHSTTTPFFALHVIWNLALVLVTLLVLLFTIKQNPPTPLWVWIAGYAFQCLLHVCFSYLDYSMAFRDGCEDELESSSSQSNCRLVKRLESFNTIISPFWWMLGFYWIVVGGQSLVQYSPHLYWLVVVFLAFDVFYVICCIGLGCAIFFFIFCINPIVAVIYTMTTKRGASEEDIRILPKHRFQEAKPLRTYDNSCGELELHPDDTKCCICLSQYVDGVELCSLPCNHHFHHGCIRRWLRINAVCPLCKSSILEADSMV